jgi:hypothetical protein
MLKVANIKRKKLVKLLKLFLQSRAKDPEVKSLIDFASPYFTFRPYGLGSKHEAREERIQLIGEFLTNYRQKRGAFVLFGDFDEQQMFHDFLSHLRNFSLDCLTPYRKKLVQAVNSVVRPANGFKKVKGKIVGLKKHINNSRPSPFSERELLFNWKNIPGPSINQNTGLPPQKELLKISREMLIIADGWVFKKSFMNGIEIICRLKELSILPFPQVQDGKIPQTDLETLHALLNNTNRNPVEVAVEQKSKERKIENLCEHFLSNLSNKWQMILYLMLIVGKTAANCSLKAKLSQQACGKAYRKMQSLLRTLLITLNEVEQKLFLIKLENALEKRFQNLQEGKKE